ncbi:hypothetical protein [Streptomyces boninensis]|uniref:hypothetical protein n=1 Tax=Streptomyces boninensis TaxID=2039455 RepID=UPI003B227E5F
MNFIEYARQADELLQEAHRIGRQSSDSARPRAAQLIAAAEVYARLADAATRNAAPRPRGVRVRTTRRVRGVMPRRPLSRQ